MDSSAARHGIARIDDEIHDDLLDLCGIGLYFADTFVGVRDHLDVFVHQAAKKFVQIEDYAIQVDRFRLKYLFAAEG